MKSDYPAIALVDDDEDIVDLFTDLLKGNGLEVFGYTNPLVLLDYIHHHAHQFRLVLIDYKLPQITGCELAQNNRHKFKNRNGVNNCSRGYC